MDEMSVYNTTRNESELWLASGRVNLASTIDVK